MLTAASNAILVQMNMIAQLLNPRGKRLLSVRAFLSLLLVILNKNITGNMRIMKCFPLLYIKVPFAFPIIPFKNDYYRCSEVGRNPDFDFDILLMLENRPTIQNPLDFFPGRDIIVTDNGVRSQLRNS